MKLRQLLKATFCDEEGNVVILQMPNVSGGITIGLIVLGRIIATEPVHGVIRAAAAITGLWWAYLEVRYGVNYFRKALGAAVALMILVDVVRTVL